MVDPGADREIPEAVTGLGPAGLCDVSAVVVVAVGCGVTGVDAGGSS